MTISTHAPHPLPPPQPAPPDPPNPSPSPDPSTGPTNPIPPPVPGRSRRHSAVAIMTFLTMLTLACGSDGASTPGDDLTRGLPSSVSRRYVGCVGPTAEPDMFVLSVAEGRDFTADSPAGTPIPQKSELPQGVSAP